ncbi:uncharacterized protein LOC135165406 [Diachasmimorpha longicaudata]|uniref:uncharacterized protein LOC135165406 n=1 Tax=Diachasmimorpha longicaudata TaxID=58733 RepID=UPI0030B8FF5A
MSSGQTQARNGWILNEDNHHQSFSQHNQEDFDKAIKVLKWNKWLLSALGLWPRNPNSIIFVINFGYFVYNMMCEYLDLFLFIDNLEHVIENLTENMAFTQILVRMAMLKLYNRQLGDVINEVFKDYDAKTYRNPAESKVFLDYMNKAKLFVKLLCAFVTMTAVSYYAKPITSPAPLAENEDRAVNATMPFVLPYQFHVFHEIDDFRTYAITYASQLPFVFVSGLGQTAADCLMVTLVFHVSGRLSVLAMRISSVRTDVDRCRAELGEIIIEHNRLLKMGQNIKEAFSETLLAHLVGATALVCIIGYQLLVNYAKGQTADLATFFVFIFLVFLVLYSHCVVAESLVTESNKVCEAYYDCLWYEMTPETAKVIILCMARSQKSLGLTAGKFASFGLRTLTDVVKTAMAYLSVLRSFELSIRSIKILRWMRWTMSAIGVGSNKRNFKFYISFFCIGYQWILLFADIATHMGNPAYIIDNLADTIGVIIVGLCFSVVCLHKTSIHNVIEFIQNNSENRGNDKQRVIVDIYNSTIEKLFGILRVYMIPCAIFSALLPILVRRPADNAKLLKEYPLPLHLYEYYTITNEVTYFATYIFRVLLIVIDVIVRLNLDFLYVITIFSLSGQIAVLVNDIENFETIDPLRLESAIADVTASYQNLIRIGREIRKIFSFYLCGSLLLSTFILCLTSYQLLDNIMKGNYFDAAMSFLWSFAILVEILVSCALGEYLIAQSSGLETAFYNCQWYDASCSFRKMLVVSLTRSQIPLSLSAGGFTIVGFPTFTAVMKTTAGYLSLLRTVM